MGNLSSHKAPAVRASIDRGGAKLQFFPPSSPDFNSIEQAFENFKVHLRKAAERATHSLWNDIGLIPDLYSPWECVQKLLRERRR